MQSKTYHFLLPAGGAINLYECGPLDLFRSGVLSNMGILVHIGHCMLSYNNFLFHGESSKFDRTPRTHPPMKTLDLRNLTSQRALDYNDQFWCSSE